MVMLIGDVVFTGCGLSLKQFWKSWSLCLLVQSLCLFNTCTCLDVTRHACTNTQGSFECSCGVGYELADDDLNCSDKSPSNA